MRIIPGTEETVVTCDTYLVRGSIQKSNNPRFERLEELLFLGSEITRSADF